MNASGSTFTIVITVVVILVIALLVMFGLNAKYKFLPAKWNLFKRLGLTQSADGTYWKSSAPATVLSLDSTQLPASFPSQYNYTLMMDVMIYNSRASTTSITGGTLPYRHLFHRGSDDLGSAGTAAGCGGGGAGTAGTTGGAGSGFPQYMNPGILGDPTTNDLWVFLDTSAGRESARIFNLELKTPYRIGLIVYQGFFEVYIGCKLFVTQLLKGTPIAIQPSGVYGLAGSSALNAKLQNLRLWSSTLPVQQMVTECMGAIQPFGPPPPCAPSAAPVAPPTPASGSAAAAAGAASIAAIVQCPSTS